MGDDAPAVTASEVLTALLGALRPVLPFVILRNHEALPETWGNDVDVLIRPEDLGIARRMTLDVMSGGRKHPGIETLGRRHFWAAKVKCADRELQVDYYTGICKAWCIYADSNVVLGSRRHGHPLYCTPDPLHEALLIAAKELFAYGRIRGRYHARLAAQGGGECLEAAKLLFSEYLTEKGCQLVAKAVKEPTATGRPGVRASACMCPWEVLAWAWRRRNTWRRLGGSAGGAEVRAG